MTSKRTPLRRLAAGVGALALASTAAVAFASSASAFEPPVGTGSLTIHKHVYDATSTPGNPKGEALGGVTFSVQEVGTGTPGSCVSIDLSTPAGWAAVKAAMDGFNSTTGALPAGYCLIGTATEQTTSNAEATKGQTTFSPLKGLYVVKETAPGPHNISQPANPFLVTVPMPVPGDPDAEPAVADSWDFSVDAFPKNKLNTTEPTKEVGESNVDDDVVAPADVPWVVTAPVPAAAFPYTAIKIQDFVATGHTFKEFGDVTLDGVVLNGPDVEAPDVPDYTVSGAIIEFTAAGLTKVNGIVTGTDRQDAEIKVNVVTTVTGTTGGAITNKASITLNGTTNTTPEPKTIWGKLKVTKHVAGNTSNTLNGAEFDIYLKSEATCEASVAAGSPVASLDSSNNPDENGVYTSDFLWIANAQATDTTNYTRDYCVVETVAPDKYLLDPTPRLVTLTANGAIAGTVVNVNVPNTKPEGPVLPNTGAEGTMLFTLAGLALVAVAGGGFLVRRSRANH